MGPNGYSLSFGKRAASQRNLPPETTMPPMELPLPLIALDVEWMTTSAPSASGWQRYGVVTVLSTKSGTPCACASSESAAMSTTSSFGLPMVSM